MAESEGSPRFFTCEGWRRRQRMLRELHKRSPRSVDGWVTGGRGYDREKEELIVHLAKARWQKWFETGKIEIIGPRHWRWRIGP